MTTGDALTLSFDPEPDGKWLALPLWQDDDPTTYAVEVVDLLSRLREVPVDPQERAALVTAWSALVVSAREDRASEGREVAHALGLVPSGATVAGHLAPRALARVCGLTRLAGGLEEVVAALVQPAALLAAQPLVDGLATVSGEAVRVRQLLREPRPSGPDQVLASVVYAWPTPYDDVVVTLDALLESPTEAALLEPVFDDLAASLRISTAP